MSCMLVEIIFSWNRVKKATIPCFYKSYCIHINCMFIHHFTYTHTHTCTHTDLRWFELNRDSGSIRTLQTLWASKLEFHSCRLFLFWYWIISWWWGWCVRVCWWSWWTAWQRWKCGWCVTRCVHLWGWVVGVEAEEWRRDSWWRRRYVTQRRSN